MSVAEVHAAVEASIGLVPRSTIKDALASHAGEGFELHRTRRGRYRAYWLRCRPRAPPCGTRRSACS
jgi:hypothetical protein